MTGFHTEIFPGEGNVRTSVQRVHSCVGAPTRVFIDFNEILDMFNYKNHQI